MGEEKIKIPRMLIDRDALTQEMFATEGGFEARDKSLLNYFRNSIRHYKFIDLLRDLVPIISWLPKYSIKNYLVGDMISGATVAVMHIPQGIAYGILAGLTPNVGLYVAFFPVLAYLIFGTSRHVSIGTFAIVSLMTLKVVTEHSTHEESKDPFLTTTEGYSPIQVATATAVMVGIIQLIMASLYLGTLANLLSEPLVNGFTTGAALHVVGSQLKDMIGVQLVRHKGPLKLIYTIIDFFSSIGELNVATLITTAIVITFMIIMNEVVKPLMQKRTKFTLPVELIAVLGGTLISKYVGLGPNYNVKLVGNIPTGLPTPEFPPISLFRLVWFDAIVIAVVSYSIDVSMAFIFAEKHSYQVSPNQELIALGIANIFGGTFSCIPAACSLSRSLIQDLTGGKTQIASAFSAFLILMILLWIGPFFETLPKAVLSGIIVVSLKGMFLQAKEVKRFAKESKIVLMLWICTFISVVLIDIDYGLVFGFILSFISLYIKGWRASYALLGNIPGTEIYVPIDSYKNAIEIPQIKIYRYFGSINFATKESYRKHMYQFLKLDIEKIKNVATLSTEILQAYGERSLLIPFKVLILDLSAVNHIDIAGCKVLTEIVQEMNKIGIKVFLAGTSVTTYESLSHGVSLGIGPFDNFPTVHDAVLYAKEWNLV